MTKDVQSEFEKNLSRAMKKAQRVSDSPDLDFKTDPDRPTDDSTIEPYSESHVPIRNFEDFIDGMDGVLRRRLWDSDKFHKNVREIRQAMKDGELVINVVAPGYKTNKELVDLIVNQALTSPMEKEFSAPTVSGKAGVSEAEKKVIRVKALEAQKAREKLQEERYDEMNQNIILDASVASVSKYARKPEEKDTLVRSLCSSAFEGSEMFNPDDNVNCLYPWVEDYVRDPNMELPSPQPPGSNPSAAEASQDYKKNRRLMRESFGDPFYPEAGRSLSSFRYKDDEESSSQIDFSYVHPKGDEMGQPVHRHGLMIKDPSSAPISKTEAAARPAFIFFDERAEFAHFRRDPRYEESYRYHDQNKDVAITEIEAQKRMNELMDRGFSPDDTVLTNKWFTFCYILSKLQESPLISIFHPGGFDSENAPRTNPVVGEQPSVPTSSSSSGSVLSEEIVSNIITSFLSSIGIENKEMSDDITNAIMSTPNTEKDDVSLKKKNPKEMTAEEVKKSLESIVEEIIGERTEDELSMEDLVQSWVESRYEKFAPFSNKIFKMIQDKIEDKKASSNDDMIKLAIAPEVSSSSLYEKITEIVMSYAKDKDIGYEIPEASGPEYVVDLLIRYLSGKVYESEIGFEVDKSGKLKDPNAILVKNKVDYAAFSFTIPFDKAQREAWGIHSEEDYNNLIHKGAQLKISSPTFSEIVSISTFNLCDSLGAKKDSFPEDDEDIAEGNSMYKTGLYVHFSPVLDHGYSAGRYSVSLVKEGGFSTAGLMDDMYAKLYGNEIASQKKEAHKKNHIELNLSIYPCWAPSPFDYRKFSYKKRVGHPNNAYNVKRALEDRLRLREALLRKIVRGPKEKSQYASGLDILDQEIAEIRLHLYGYVMHKYDSYKSPVGVDERDMSRTLARSYGSQSQDNMYREIRYRCSLEGFEIGNFNNLTNVNVVRRALSEENFQKFLAISAQVKKEFGRRRSIAIFRSVDANIVNVGDTNGFMVKSSSSKNDNEGLAGRFWSPSFSNAVNGLKDSLVSMARGRPLRSHIILISESPLPDLAGKNTVVYIQDSTISKKEIELMVDYYVTMVKKEESMKKPSERSKIADASGFTIFQTVIKRMGKKLSGLGFSDVCTFIERTVRELFSEYMKTGDLVNTYIGYETKINGEMDRLRTDWESKAKGLLPKGSEIRPSRFKYSDYAVKLRSEWANWLDSKLKPTAKVIEECNAKINFFMRALETDCLFGSFTLQNDERNPKNPRCFVRFSFYDSAPVGIPMVWFSSPQEGGAFLTATPDKVLMQMATAAGFSISDNLASFISREKESMGKSQEFKPSHRTSPFHEKGYPLHIADAPLSIKGEHLTRYKADLNAAITKYQGMIDRAIKTFPSLILLQGEPGTGKSIFGEVLATVLDCKFVSTNFEKMGYAGESSLRGVVEENFNKFTEICRSSEDTVFLIDEIDKFILQAQGKQNSSGASALISHLLRAWEIDEPTYRSNNVHIVLTTNELQVIQEVSSALLTRISASGGIHQVELPGDAKSLMSLFTNGSVFNSILMEAFDKHEDLIETVREILSLSESSDESDKARMEILAERIQKQWPDALRSCPIRPSQARLDWLEQKELKTSEDRESSTPLEDFIEGWKMVKQLLSDLNTNVGVVVEGKEEKFNPLSVICTKFSNKMFFKSSSGKTFAKSTLREFIAMLRKMMKGHQEFLSGKEQGALPFNWKTLLAVVQASAYGGIQIQKKDQAIRMGMTESEFDQVTKEPKRDGFDHVETFSKSISPNGTSIPREFWMTQKQYEEEVTRVSGYIKSKKVEKNGDKGFRYLAEKINDALYFNNPSFESSMSALHDYIKVDAAEGKDPTEIIDGYFEEYNSLREQVRALLSKRIPDIQKMSQLLGAKGVAGPLRIMVNAFVNFKETEGPSALGYFSADGSSYKNIYDIYLKNMGALVRALGLVDDMCASPKGDVFQRKWETVTKRAKEVFDTEKKESDELFTDVMMRDGSLTRKRFELLTKGVPSKKWVQFSQRGIQMDVPDITGEEQVTEKPAVPSGVTPLSPPVILEVPEFKSVDEYDRWAVDNKLHTQSFKVGDNVRILNPKGKAATGIYTIEDSSTSTGTNRSINPSGVLFALSDGVGSWEPKDIVSENVQISKSTTTIRENAPVEEATNPNTPAESVSKPAESAPTKNWTTIPGPESVGAKKPKSPPAGIDLSSTTNYYYKVAKTSLEMKKDNMVEKDKTIVKKAIQMSPKPASQDTCADLLMSSDLEKIVQVRDNKNRSRAEKDKGAYGEKCQESVEIWKFF